MQADQCPIWQIDSASAQTASGIYAPVGVPPESVEMPSAMTCSRHAATLR